MCQGRRSLLSTLHASEQSRGRVCAARRIRFRMTGEGGDVGEVQASGVWL